MKLMKQTLLYALFILTLNLSAARAEDETQVEVTKTPSFSWTQFELGATSAFQSGGFNTYSGIIRWTPEFHANNAWSFGLDLGFTDFKYSDATHALVLEYAASVRYSLGNWSLKALVGAQSWTSGPYHTYFMVGPEVAYTFDQPALKFINSVFVSYTPVLKSGYTVNEIAAGFGFKL